MSADATLRPAVEADVLACFNLDQRCFPPDIAFAREVFDDLFASSEIFWVAEQNGRLVGFIVAIMDETDHTGLIATIDVESERRRQGVGHRLLSQAHRLLATRGVDSVFLHVSPDNESALRLYEKHEYISVTRFRDYYGTRRDALLMMRTLGNGDL